MTEQQRKLSRRDALKALGAALGGSALAALPPAWSKPVLAADELPEHARQSEPIATEEPVCPDITGEYDVMAEIDGENLFETLEATISQNGDVYTLTIRPPEGANLDGPIIFTGTFDCETLVVRWKVEDEEYQGMIREVVVTLTLDADGSLTGTLSQKVNGSTMGSGTMKLIPQA